jgi:hypothetical protein
MLWIPSNTSPARFLLVMGMIIVSVTFLYLHDPNQK